MKATITRTDGVKIEAEGTADEIAALVGLVAKVEHHWHYTPALPVAPYWINPYLGGITYTRLPSNNAAAACLPGATWA